MKNIHVIPTDKPSRLWTNNLRRRLELDEFPSQHPSNIAKNIYITSNEEIKEGDCIFETDTNTINIVGKDYYRNEFDFKIILTTDLELQKDSVQAIDDEFLEWFVKNPSCEFIQTERLEDGQYFDYLEDNSVIEGIYENYKIIIPQEEFKQEPERGITITHVGKQETKMIECYFIPNNNTSSTTICGNCGKEKFLHTIGSGIKVSKSVILTQEEPKQEKINMNTHYVDFSNPNADNISSASTTSMKQDNNFYEKLKQYFEETPREKVLEDWAKSAEYDKVGPTVDDFLNNTNKQETLEESIERLIKLNRQDAFYEGAKWQQEQTFKQKLVIELNEYDYTGSSNDIYGMVVKVNGVEMPYHNLDTSTILEEVLEHLGYEVEIIETLDR
jgi:hypothetical protein